MQTTVQDKIQPGRRWSVEEANKAFEDGRFIRVNNQNLKATGKRTFTTAYSTWKNKHEEYNSSVDKITSSNLSNEDKISEMKLLHEKFGANISDVFLFDKNVRLSGSIKHIAETLQANGVYTNLEDAKNYVKANMISIRNFTDPNKKQAIVDELERSNSGTLKRQKASKESKKSTVPKSSKVDIDTDRFHAILKYYKSGVVMSKVSDGPSSKKTSKAKPYTLKSRYDDAVAEGKYLDVSTWDGQFNNPKGLKKREIKDDDKGTDKKVYDPSVKLVSSHYFNYENALKSLFTPEELSSSRMDEILRTIKAKHDQVNGKESYVNAPVPIMVPAAAVPQYPDIMSSNLLTDLPPAKKTAPRTVNGRRTKV